ncbi:MAG: hypothetical protein CVV45_17080 [Spirochaetae bacterium HGW-Spirochaetae-10]|nr:MAG: hypothetical protein CVV45_17080 [Spirochaetae bacterium HGW-Spirochaetae-10]
MRSILKKSNEVTIGRANIHFTRVLIAAMFLSGCHVFLGYTLAGAAEVVEYLRSLTYGRTDGDHFNCNLIMKGRTEGEAIAWTHTWRKVGIKTGAVADSGVLLYGFYYTVTAPYYLLLGTPIAIP